MSDRELMELAAKAEGRPAPWDQNDVFSAWVGDMENGHWWNPLNDDGDALRLMVKLQLELTVFRDHVTVFHATSWCDELHNGNPEAATRLAIVRAAAEVGGAMP